MNDYALYACTLIQKWYQLICKWSNNWPKHCSCYLHQITIQIVWLSHTHLKLFTWTDRGTLTRVVTWPVLAPKLGRIPVNLACLPTTTSSIESISVVTDETYLTTPIFVLHAVPDIGFCPATSQISVILCWAELVVQWCELDWFCAPQSRVIDWAAQARIVESGVLMEAGV